MKNTKEIHPILTAIHCINTVSKHRDPDIWKLTDYAFRTFFGANTNLLTYICLGKTKEEIMPEVMKVLEKDTKYKKYLDEYSTTGAKEEK